jgi:hypothetical protein
MENHIPGTMMLLTVKNSDKFLSEVKSLGGCRQAIEAWIDDMNKQFEPYNFQVSYQQFSERLHISRVDSDKHPFVYDGDTRTSHHIMSTVQDVYKLRECLPTLIDLLKLVKEHPEMFKHIKLDIPNSCVTLERCTSIGKVRTKLTIMASLDTMRDTEAKLTLTVDELDYRNGNHEFTTEYLTPVVETFFENVESVDNLAECVKTLAINLNEQAMRESILLRLYK